MALMYHIKAAPGDIAPYVLLPGDPKRVPLVAALWDEAHLVGDNREHCTYTGTYKGMPITCTSTGMGCPSTAIAMEELARCGATTFLRMGTCGSMQPYVKQNDICVFDSACRFEGTTKMYVPTEYPAVANHQMVEGIIQSLETSGLPYHVGTSRCVDAIFTYRPEPETSFHNYHPHNWDSFLTDLAQANVIAGEMESSAVLVLSRIWGLRGAALCIAVGDLMQYYRSGEKCLFDKSLVYNDSTANDVNQVACDAMLRIYQNDQQRNGQFK